MMDIFIGYDPREASAYHTLCDSILRRTSAPVRIVPLFPNICGVGQRDGSNTFTYSRFLVPHLMNYEGHALYMDSDMLCFADIAEVFALTSSRDELAVSCVKHDYETVAAKKYLGNKNENYPRKNWSSLMLFNCAHELCRYLTPKIVKEVPGAILHRFKWCTDEHIGALPKEWNHLVGEQPLSSAAKIAHFTLGTPCFPDYYRSDYAKEWRDEFAQACRPVPQFFRNGDHGR